jgi:UDP-N-acetylmuramyl pentapeptide phosphotransferase/UDP-N-acetylglucosamine-1-phosphate transferase
MADRSIEQFLGFALAAVAALILSLALNFLLRPLLVRHALARPNARSSHRQPTPQGGGVAVVAATLAVTWVGIALMPAASQGESSAFLMPTAAAVLLALVGWIDDVRALPAAPRLALQCVAAGAVIMALPADINIAPAIPPWLERACLFVGLVWFVNVVNFMDGIDWMTVAETIPITAAIVLFGLINAVEFLPGLVGAALFGAMLGFGPLNKPVATLFLGDVGSLPIGLLLGWLLLMLAGQGHWAAALLLPLYYLADATLTLMRRVAAREPFWQAHRSHFYQRATDVGFTVNGIVVRVFATNLALAGLAIVTVAAGQTTISLISLLLGGAIVGAVLVAFGRGKR